MGSAEKEKEKRNAGRDAEQKAKYLLWWEYFMRSGLYKRLEEKARN